MNHLEFLPIYHQFKELHGENAELVFAYFSIFSRFEFALKASITYCKNGFGDSSAPNWNKFAEDIQGKFNPDKTPALREAFDYYIKQPPKIQIFKDNKLSWQENKKPTDKSEIEWVLSSIRVVRNNLFHGGKFPYDQVRDSSLLDYGLVILNECLELDKNLHTIFMASPTLAE